MAEDPTMAKLEALHGIYINEHIRPPNMREHQVNLPSGIINTLYNNYFMGSSTKESHTHCRNLPSGGGAKKASWMGQGCVFHRRKMRGVATNIYSRKTSKKPKWKRLKVSIF